MLHPQSEATQTAAESTMTAAESTRTAAESTMTAAGSTRTGADFTMVGTGSRTLDDEILEELFRTPRPVAPEAEPRFRKPSKLASTISHPMRPSTGKGYKKKWEGDDADEDEDEDDGSPKKKWPENLVCAKCLKPFADKRYLKTHIAKKKCPGKPESGFNVSAVATVEIRTG